MDFDGSRGNVRGKYEATETIRRNDALAKRERMEAGAARERLEKQGSVGKRADLGRIVAMATCDGLARRSLEGTLGSLRKMAQGKMRKAVEAQNERFVTPLIEGQTYDRVRDADGSMAADARTRAGHWDDQGISDAMESLSVEDMAHLTRQMWRNRFF